MKRITHLFGIGLAVLAMLFFAVTYAFYKACGSYLPNTHTIFFQSLFSWVLVLPFVLRDGVKGLASPHIGKIVLRTLFGVISMYFITLALQKVSLAEVITLNNAAPLFVPLILWIWHRDWISRKLAFTLLIGFAGVWLVLQPGFHAIKLPHLFALLSGISSALLLIFTRQIAHEPFRRILFYYFLIFWVVLLPFVFTGWAPFPPKLWLYIVSASVAMICAQISFTYSLRFASSHEVAPLLYTSVIFAGLIDWVVWKETPDLLSILGMLIVCVGGVLTLTLSQKKSDLKEEAIILIDAISTSLFFKHSVREMGYKVVAIFTKPLSAFKASFHLEEKVFLKDCDEVIIGEEKEKVLEELKKSRFKLKAVFPGLDSAVILADGIAEALGLFGNPATLSHARRDKGEMRRVLKEKGFSCPDFQVCKSEEELISFAKAHAFPLVVKTPRGAGTQHVYICDDLKRLTEKFHAILNDPDFFGVQAHSAIVEEYIGGEEYIIDTFSNGEKVFVTDIWKYEKIDTETFHNIYYNCFSLPLSDAALKPLIDLAIKLVEAFEIKRGPAHLEIKVDPRLGPTLIEINARFAGIRIPLMLKKCSNFDPFKKTAEVIISGKTEVPQPILMHKHCAIVCCPLFETGKVENIMGLDAIEKLASYEGHQLNVSEGDFIVPTTDMTSIPLIVFLAHADQKTLLKDVERTHALFRVRLAA